MGRGKAQRSLDLIAAAREILEEIQPATVRAVCYRLFTQGLIESMAKSETNRVGTQLTWAREHGEIPWAWIVDETREAEIYRHGWENPQAFLRAASRSYRQDFWAHQPVYVEVWSEKGTVRGTLAPVLEGYGVTFRVMHGYGSATALHEVAELSAADRKPWRVFYVGDWDPSGLHMSEVDLPRRLARYGADGEREAALAWMVKQGGFPLAMVQEAAKEVLGPTEETVRVTRVALTTEDITHGDLPSFDADTKGGDPRWRWYVIRYGRRCWELDALSPVILRERVKAAICGEIEPDAWERCRRAEAAEQESLARVFETVGRSISRQASKYEASP